MHLHSLQAASVKSCFTEQQTCLQSRFLLYMAAQTWLCHPLLESGKSGHSGQGGLKGVLRAGKREWPAFRDWFARNLAPALDAWMGDVGVVYDGQEKLDPGSKYVFGYAPHGLFPIGAPLQQPSLKEHRSSHSHLTT